MTRRIIPAAVAALASVTMLACDGSSTTGGTITTDATISADEALTAADAINGDVAMMIPPAGGASLIAFDGKDDDPGRGCSPLAGHFDCPTRFIGGLGWHSTLTFYDASNVLMTAFDTLLTASMHIDADISGTVSHDHWTADVGRHRHFIVSGLLGTETTRTWNGVGADTLHRSTHTDNPDKMREYEVTGLVTVTDVVVPVKDNGESSHFPSSGTMTIDLKFEGIAGDVAGQTFTSTATVTFNGTTKVPFHLGGHHWWLDLSARSLAKID